MPLRRVHLIHVGNMANKGTQALLKSDVSILREVLGCDCEFSVSTTDAAGVRRLGLSLDVVCSPMVDIPYEKADFLSKRLGVARTGWAYKLLALTSLFAMPFQMILTAVSAFMVKNGLPVIYRQDALNCIRKSELIISYSDENFKEGTLYLPSNIYWTLAWWTILLSRTWDILVGRYFKKRIIMFPNSLGPFRTRFGRLLAKLSLDSCDLVLVRDQQSWQLSDSLHINSDRILTYDITWLFKSGSDVGLEKYPHPLLGVSPGVYSHVFSTKSMANHVRTYAEAIDKAIDEYGFFVILLPNYITGFGYDDLEISKMIVAEMVHKDRTAIISVDNADEFKSLISTLDITVSSRLHPSIFALSSKVPSVCIAYDHKQTSLYERIGLGDFAIGLHEFSKETLFSSIIAAWNNRYRIKESLDARIPQIQENVTQAVRYALLYFSDRKRA